MAKSAEIIYKFNSYLSENIIIFHIIYGGQKVDVKLGSLKISDILGLMLLKVFPKFIFISKGIPELSGCKYDNF